MLTDTEKQHLQALLGHAVNPSEAFTLTQLEGYLFGLAITPDATEPGEWFTDIFGESLASFADSEEADRLFGSLTQTYRRLHALHRSDTLDFPFDLSQRDDTLLERVQQWAVGLDRALALRAYIWMPEEVLEQPEMDEDNETIMNCLLIVLGVAHPVRIPEIFEQIEEQGDDIHTIWSSLVDELPLAVAALQEHAVSLVQDKADDDQEQGPSRKTSLCSCGSGKPYLQCCGLN